MPKGVYKRTEYHREITRKGIKRVYSSGNNPRMGFQFGHKDIVPSESRKIVGEKMIGKNHWHWKGDDIKKSAAHKRMIKKYGQPDYCEHCKRIDKKKYEWANKDHKYSLKVSDWQRLCTSCHRKYDVTFNNYKEKKL